MAPENCSIVTASVIGLKGKFLPGHSMRWAELLPSTAIFLPIDL